MLLFVQHRGGQPQVLRRAVRRERWEAGCIGGYRGVRISQSPAYFVSKGTNDLLFSGAVRWWLVECENPEAGRAIIAGRARFSAPGKVVCSGPLQRAVDVAASRRIEEQVGGAEAVDG